MHAQLIFEPGNLLLEECNRVVVSRFIVNGNLGDFLAMASDHGSRLLFVGTDVEGQEATATCPGSIR
jgi:hypothetical protein